MTDIPTEPTTEIIKSTLLRNSREQFGDRYDQIVLTEYSLYVEMADRISARRHSANSYFLAANSLLVALSGFLTSQAGEGGWKTGLPLALVPLAGIALCFVWYHLVRSYRQLNTAKFKVVHEIELLLPLAPYDAEWEAVERGKNPDLYRPFTDVEKWVPTIFGALYVGALSLTIWNALA